MDFGNTPATKLTERIMRQIQDHLREEAANGMHQHYNRVYDIVHREVLADMLVARLKPEPRA